MSAQSIGPGSTGVVALTRAMFTHRRRAGTLDVSRIGVAVAVTTAVCWAVFRTGEPVFGMIGALVTAQPLARDSVGRALERGLVVVLGVTLTFVLVSLVGAGQWVALPAVLAAVAITWFVGAGTASATQVGVIAILILSPAAGSPVLAGERIAQTAIGTAVGVAVSILAQPVSLRTDTEALTRFGAELTAVLDELAATLRTGLPTMVTLEGFRRVRASTGRVGSAVERSRSALAFDPWASRRRAVVEGEEHRFAHLERIAIEAVGLTRTLVESDDSAPRASTSAELERLAADLRAALTGAGARTREKLRAPSSSTAAAIEQDLGRINVEINGLTRGAERPPRDPAS